MNLLIPFHLLSISSAQIYTAIVTDRYVGEAIPFYWQHVLKNEENNMWLDKRRTHTRQAKDALIIGFKVK